PNGARRNAAPSSPGPPLRVDDGDEAAVDQAPAVERHRALVRLPPRVGYDLLPAGLARFLRRPFGPGKDDRLAVLRLHRPPEVGELAVGHVVAPVLDHAQGTA